MIMQAGQVLLFAKTWSVTQLASLTQRQLRACLEQYRGCRVHDEHRLCVRDWNREPVEGSPAAGLLGELGFRYDAKRALRWPGGSQDEAPKAAAIPEPFPPYYLASGHATYDREWVISHAADAVRQKLVALLDLLERLPPDQKEFVYRPYGVELRHKGQRYATFHPQRRKINLHITHKGWVPPILIMPDTDLSGPGLVAELRTRIENTCRTIDKELASPRR
jgi:hypothetical protein